MALPFLEESDWSAEVVCSEAAQVDAPQDKLFDRTYPQSITIHRVRSIGLAWKWLPGLGTLGWRCYRAIKCKLFERLEVLQNEGINPVVYFSTTQFAVHGMIPEMVRRFQIPVFMDYQDPWVNDYYEMNPAVAPPGGRIKFGVAQILAKRAEKKVLPFINGFSAVSERYPQDLRKRYKGQFKLGPSLVLPFAACEKDLEISAQVEVTQSIYDPNDGYVHWVYVGRGGQDMAFAVRSFFKAFRCALSGNSYLNNVRMHFVGTDYAAGNRASKSIQPIAEEQGIGRYVTEQPNRIPYFQGIRCLLDSDALIVPGSDDAGYTASKIYPYILANKPLLTLFHEESSVNLAMRQSNAGISCTFLSGDSVERFSEKIEYNWFATKAWQNTPDTNWVAFEPFTARSMTQKLLAFISAHS